MRTGTSGQQRQERDEGQGEKLGTWGTVMCFRDVLSMLIQLMNDHPASLVPAFDSKVGNLNQRGKQVTKLN